VVCRVFKKNKNLKMKLQERATVSYEEAPEIVSSGGRFGYPGVKQEIINLDEYQITSQAGYGGYGVLEQQQFQQAQQSHSMPSSVEARAYLARALSFRRPDDYLNIPDSLETSSGTSDGATTDPEDCGTLLGLAENVDWSALLQEPPVTKTSANNPDSMILKRQNSDIFSSMDLWPYSQVAQHM
jgi:hypothetical protein